MKVLLLHAPAARPTYLSMFSTPEPLTHLFLGPALAQHHEIRFVDLRITPSLGKELDGFRPEAAIVGVNPLDYPSLEKALGDLRNRYPGIKILLIAEAEYGNSHLVERPLDLAHPLADALFQPFYLAVMQKNIPLVLQAWKENRSPAGVPGLWVQKERGRWTQETAAANQLDDIGVPDRTLLRRARGRYRFGGIGQMAHLFYTFGCKHKCRFCPMSKHDGTISARNLSDVMTELSEMTEPNVFLQDYEPFLAPRAMESLAEAIEKSHIRKNFYMMTRSDTALAEYELIARWKKIGLRWLYLGLDGFSAERLKEIRKGNTLEKNEAGLRKMQELGLGVSVGFTVPSDFGREDFAALREYVGRLRPPLFDFTVETPLVGTTLFDETESRLTTRDWSLFDLQHAVLPTKLPLHEFYREMTKLHLWAGMRSLPAMVRHFPLPDLVRSWASGPGALWGVWQAAADHGRAA